MMAPASSSWALFLITCAGLSVQGAPLYCQLDCLLQDSWCTVQCQSLHFQTEKGIVLPDYKSKIQVDGKHICLLFENQDVCEVNYSNENGFKSTSTCVFAKCPTTMEPPHTPTNSMPPPDQIPTKDNKTIAHAKCPNTQAPPHTSADCTTPDKKSPVNEITPCAILFAIFLICAVVAGVIVVCWKCQD